MPVMTALGGREMRSTQASLLTWIHRCALGKRLISESGTVGDFGQG